MKLLALLFLDMMEERGYIYHTAVSEKFRKKGIGQKLVASSLSALKTEGINKVALVVFSKNKLDNLFWEKIGFRKREDLIYRDKTINEMEKITI